jgi:hypothetical protein
MCPNTCPSAMKMAPRRSLRGAISTSSGDRIRTCDLWVMSYAPGVFSLFARCQRCRSVPIKRPIASVMLHSFERVSRRFVPKSVPKAGGSSNDRRLPRRCRRPPVCKWLNALFLPSRSVCSFGSMQVSGSQRFHGVDRLSPVFARLGTLSAQRGVRLKPRLIARSTAFQSSLGITTRHWCTRGQMFAHNRIGHLPGQGNVTLNVYRYDYL